MAVSELTDVGYSWLNVLEILRPDGILKLYACVSGSFYDLGMNDIVYFTYEGRMKKENVWGLKVTVALLLCPARREGGNKRCFCPPSVRPSICLSVCPSVAYIENNSRTQKPSVPIFGRKVSHLRCDSQASLRSTSQRSGPPHPIMLTHIVRHISRLPRPTNVKRMEDDDSHQPQAL